jgi:hypothetical protein
VSAFIDAEVARHGRTTGWRDAAFYDAVHGFLDRQRAPDDVRASVELMEGLRSLDFERAAAAADRLQLRADRAPLLPPRLLLDAAVAAYLGADHADRAAAAYDALAPRTGRAPDNARNRWLASLIGR